MISISFNYLLMDIENEIQRFEWFWNISVFSPPVRKCCEKLFCEKKTKSSVRWLLCAILNFNLFR